MEATKIDFTIPPKNEIENIQKMEQLIENGQELVKVEQPSESEIRAVAVELMDGMIRAKEYYVQRHTAHSYECSEMITKLEPTFKNVMDTANLGDFSIFMGKCLGFVSRVKEDFTVKQKLAGKWVRLLGDSSTLRMGRIEIYWTAYLNLRPLISSYGRY